MAKKIKVAGYTQKINYTGGISYRPFSTLNTDVVNDNTFVSGDFNVSVNIDPKTNKVFRSKDFTDYMSLNTIGIEDTLLETYNKQKTKLKLNPTLLKNYAYFGSLKERLRVAMENIIIHFPAGLKVNPYIINNGSVLSVNSLRDMVLIDGNYWVKISHRNIENPFGIKYNNTDGVSALYNTENKWRDFTKEFLKYSIFVPDLEISLPILGYVVDSSDVFMVRLDITPEMYDVIATKTLIIRPNDAEVESFFMNLDSLESELLNRTTTPQYTYTFKTRKYTDLGIFIESNVSDTWVTSDGWNLDFQNGDYVEYVSNLINLAEEIDNNDANLIVRQMVTSSLLDYDTISTDIYENIYDTSQKIKTILTIYGRSFDDVKNHIDGISFATNVSYDEQDNASDKYIRDIAKSMGWEMFETKSVIDMVQNIYERSVDHPTYNLTPDELEVEIWRRLILNTPYLMKSKGTRKAIEFINRFLGIPKGLFEFNEYVYKAKNKANVSDIELIQYNMQGYSDIYELPIDSDGYPQPKPDNDDVYFQQSGGWYTISGGELSEIDITTGNNPHVGSYDSGKSYLLQFSNMIPNFEPMTIKVDTTIENVDNLITTYTNGTFENNLGTILHNDDVAIIKVEPKTPKTMVIDECGCIVTDVTTALSVIPVEYTEEFSCEYDKATFDSMGFVDFYLGVNQVTPTEECCSDVGGLFRYNHTLGRYTCEFTPFIDCARYVFEEYDESTYFQIARFRDLDTNSIVTSVPSDECCPADSEGYLDEYSGTYSCRRVIQGVDIRNKCIRIDSVYNMTPIETSSYIKFDLHQYNQPHIEVLDVQTQLYLVDKVAKVNTNGASISYVVDGESMFISRADFENASGTHLQPNEMTQTMIVTNTINDYAKIEITFTYIDCPPFIGSTNCFRIDEIAPITPANEPNIKIYFESFVGGMQALEKPSNTTINLNESMMGMNNVHYSGVITLVVDDEVKEIQLSSFNLPLNENTIVPISFNNGKSYKMKITRIICPTCSYTDIREDLLSNFIQTAPPFEIVSFRGINGQYTHVQDNAECCPYGTVQASYGGFNYCKKVVYLPESTNFCIEWDDIVYGNNPIQPQLTTFPFFYSDENNIEQGFIGEVRPTQGVQILNTNNNFGFVMGSVYEAYSPISMLMGSLNNSNNRYVIRHNMFAGRPYISEESITVNNLNVEGYSPVKVMLRPRIVLEEPCSPQAVQTVEPCFELGVVTVSPEVLSPLPVNFLRVDELNTDGRILSRRYVDLATENIAIPTVTPTTRVELYPIVGADIGSVNSSSRTLRLANNDILTSKLTATDLFLNGANITIEDFYLAETVTPNRIDVQIGGISNYEPTLGVGGTRIIPCDLSDSVIRQPITNLPQLPTNPYPSIPTPDPEPEPLDPCISIPSLGIVNEGGLILGRDYIDVSLTTMGSKTPLVSERITLDKDLVLPVIAEDEELTIYPVTEASVGAINKNTNALMLKHTDLVDLVGTTNFSMVVESATQMNRGNIGTISATNPIVRVPCITREVLSNECLEFNELSVVDMETPFNLIATVNSKPLETNIKNIGQTIDIGRVNLITDVVELSPILGVINPSTQEIDHSIIGNYNPNSLTLTLDRESTPYISRLTNFDVAVSDENNPTRVGTIRIPINNCD